MKIELLRHATCLIIFKNKKILLDPMLSPSGTLPAIPQVPNSSMNPLADLPGNVDLGDLISGLHAILVTHTHQDHFDNTAVAILPKAIPLFCQPEDVPKIQNAGFMNPQPVVENSHWGDITIFRTTGQHGTGEIGRKMGPISGFVLKAPGEPVFYITGDSIWCPEIRYTLQTHRPEVIICFAGAAQFHEGDPITMTAEDIFQVSQNAPQAKIVIVHMEAWNHCRLSRKKLQTFLKLNSLTRVAVPENGDCLIF
ncbi:MAG TPA: hypothetical protein DDW50_10775 [Firmicutes bacterium]|nr:hypothetical protein [Bacillota bacterium]